MDFDFQIWAIKTGMHSLREAETTDCDFYIYLDGLLKASKNPRKDLINHSHLLDDTLMFSDQRDISLAYLARNRMELEDNERMVIPIKPSEYLIGGSISSYIPGTYKTHDKTFYPMMPEAKCDGKSLVVTYDTLVIEFMGLPVVNNQLTQRSVVEKPSHNAFYIEKCMPLEGFEHQSSKETNILSKMSSFSILKEINQNCEVKVLVYKHRNLYMINSIIYRPIDLVSGELFSMFTIPCYSFSYPENHSDDEVSFFNRDNEEMNVVDLRGQEYRERVRYEVINAVQKPKAEYLYLSNCCKLSPISDVIKCSKELRFSFVMRSTPLIRISKSLLYNFVQPAKNNKSSKYYKDGIVSEDSEFYGHIKIFIKDSNKFVSSSVIKNMK